MVFDHYGFLNLLQKSVNMNTTKIHKKYGKIEKICIVFGADCLYVLKRTEWGTTPSVNQLFNRLNVSLQMVVSKWIITVNLIKPTAQFRVAAGS